MNRNLANELIDSLAKHPRIITPDREKFLEILASATIEDYKV